MDEATVAVRPPLAAYEDLARMMDFAVLAPELAEDDVHRACQIAAKYRIARLTVRPADLDLVSQWMKGTALTVGAVVSYPHGADTTSAKLYAVRDALGRGARAIETPMNPGKLASRQFRYLESELMQMAQECRRAGAEIIVDVEFNHLPEDLRVIACRIARRADVDWIRTGSAHGQTPDWEHLAFVAPKLGHSMRLDAGPLVRSLEDAQRSYEIGCGGFQTTDPTALLESWIAELKRREQESQNAGLPANQADGGRAAG